MAKLVNGVNQATPTSTSPQTQNIINSNIDNIASLYPDYLLLCITTNKENPKYKELQTILKDDNIKKELSQRKINIVENIIDDKTKFSIALYNMNMNLLFSFENPPNIKEVLNITNKQIDEMLKAKPMSGGRKKQNSQSQNGGNISYKEKYYKYKQKYNLMKNVITDFVGPYYK